MNDDVVMLPGERLDDLQRGSLRILQKPDGFCFGMDSVLLAAFAAPYAKEGRSIDLGTGSGILPLLICAREPKAGFDAVEIQPAMADMAARSVALNGMGDRIAVHTLDMRDAPAALGYERYRLAVCNPPYGATDGQMQNPDVARRIARHEGEADIFAICKAAGALLQNGGHLVMVYPVPRMLFLMDAMRAARVEPKHVRMVHPRWGEAPNIMLVEGKKAAKPLLHVRPPLYVRDENGRETQELRRIYEDDSI